MVGKEKYAIDDIDLGILAHLQEDARKPFSAIAQDLGLSITTVSNRYRRMIDSGILSITASVIPSEVGFNASATIGIMVEPRHLEEAYTEIIGIPEVSWMALVTGEFNLLIEVWCRDPAHLRDLMIKRLGKVIGLRQSVAFYQLQTLKNQAPGIQMLLDAHSREVGR